MASINEILRSQNAKIIKSTDKEQMKSIEDLLKSMGKLHSKLHSRNKFTIYLSKHEEITIVFDSTEERNIWYKYIKEKALETKS